MSLDDILKEAKEAQLTPDQLVFVKREYYNGIIQYNQRHPDIDYFKFGSAILALTAHRTNEEYCGEAHARAYIQAIKEKNNGTRQPNRSLGTNGDNKK